MTLNHRLLTIFVATAGSCIAATAHAEVKSLSSSELTDTYIKDSTIIVTPKKKEEEKSETEQRSVSSLTIAPIDSSEFDIEQLQQSDQHTIGTGTAVTLNDDLLRNNSVESALFPLESVNIPTYQERTTVPVADALNDERYRVPEGDFDYNFLGQQGVGLSRNGDQITFSIGNPSQVPNNIELPNGMNEAPLQIVPRVDGGFDMTINIPQDN